MTEAGAAARSKATSPAPEAVGELAQAWYLYGITWRGPLVELLVEADGGRSPAAEPIAESGNPEPLQLLEFSDLAAVVRPVPRAEFTPPVLRERLRSAAELEAMVLSHNRVIEAIHRRQAILPAKFGSVYAHAEDVVSALRPVQDTLLRQLTRLQGCDEWAVHLYADRASVRERIAAIDPGIRRLREEHAAARPGRAYFLERQLRDELETATREALVTLAQSAFDRLAEQAVTGEVNPVGRAPDADGDTEILRASFLVARDGIERFQQEVSACGAAGEGLRSEYSGPWPPYSFAPRDDEDAA